ncbi:MAG TPA: hypothetical protein VF765_10210 [Polyangiaceae bacterium]
MPGRVLGTYTVTGQSKSNTCGLGAPDPWKFTVQLSMNGSTFYWSWLDGSPLLSAPMSSSGLVSLKNSQEVNADSTDAGLGPCTLQREDDLEITLGAGTTPATFSGTIGYAYAPATGATCTDVLSASGGSFSNLPCAVSYGVTGSRN